LTEKETIINKKNAYQAIDDRKRPVGNIGLASVGQTVHIEIFVIFAIGSAILTGKVLLKPARRHSLVRYTQA